MHWGKYLGLLGIATFKFMVAPFGGKPMKLSFIETYLACVSGAILSAAIFFFLSEFLLKLSREKRIRKRREARKSGLPLPAQKNFKLSNKIIIRIKHIFGIYGICFLAPLFLSIPLGTIIAVRFYGKDKRTFPLIVTGILISGFILTSLAYMKQIIHFITS